jgi:hypothetical protein
MEKKLQDYVNITPEFLKKFDGQRIQFGNTIYAISTNGINEYPAPTTVNRENLSQQPTTTFDTYSPYVYNPQISGNQQDNPWFQFLKQNTTEYKQAEVNNFGQGGMRGQTLTPQQEEYQRLLLTGMNPQEALQKSFGSVGNSYQTSQPQYQILNLESMARYSPNQYQRLASGAVILNPGVTPIPGTVKDYTAPNNQPPSSNNGSTPSGTPSGTSPTQSPTTSPTGTPMDSLINDLNSEIDAMPYTNEQKAILKEIAKGSYTSGHTIPDTATLTKIIEDAATNAQTDLSPYYERMTGQQIADLRQNMENIRAEASRYGQQEAVDYKKKLLETKQSLRARGLTFSGTGRELLGNEGVISGEGVKGAIPEQREMDWASKEADWQNMILNVGIPGERQLGTSAVGDTNFGAIQTPYNQRQITTRGILGNTAGITYPNEPGALNLEKQSELEKSKWSRVQAYRAYI